MYMYMYIYIYIYIYMYIYIYISAIHIHIHLYIYVYIYIYQQLLQHAIWTLSARISRRWDHLRLLAPYLMPTRRKGC